MAWCLSTVLAVVMLGPLLLSRGFALVGDMVFVPEQPWKPAWLGLDGGVPRAVPSDALTWLAGLIAPGDLVQKAVLVLALVGAGVGTARLVSAVSAGSATGGPDPASWRRDALVATPAVVLFVWNPFVYERLAIGHWALLCGYAALPWVALGARRLRDGPVSAALPLAVPLAVAAWTSPSGGLLAGLTAIVVVVSRPRLVSAAGCLLVVAVVNLPWLAPALLNGGGGVAPSSFGVEAFAARSDTPWGTLGSLLSFGGMWKESVDPPGRDTWVLSGVGLALTLVGLIGVAMLRRREPRLAVALFALGAGSLLLAWLPSVAVGQDLMAWTVTHVPGGGLLRDSQKWVAPLVLVVSVGVGEIARALTLRSDSHRRSWVIALVALPLAALPGLAWGLLGTLRPVSYPAEWTQVRAVMDDVGAADGRTVVLPFSVYRRFDWNDERAVLDPAPRFFPGQTLVNDALPVRGGVVAGESAQARRIAEATADPDSDPARDPDSDPDSDPARRAGRLAAALAEEEVRWVLVEKGTPGGADAVDAVEDLSGSVLHDGAGLRLVDLGGPIGEVGPTTIWPVVLANGAALALAVAGALAGCRRPDRFRPVVPYADGTGVDDVLDERLGGQQ